MKESSLKSLRLGLMQLSVNSYFENQSLRHEA